MRVFAVLSEAFAVVGNQYDQRVVIVSKTLQFVENPANLCIHVCDFAQVCVGRS